MSLNRLNSIARLSLVGAGSSLAGYAYWNRDGGAERPVVLFNADTVTPSRQTHFTNLADGTKEYPYDILIIGGGATGTGCALDAATRWDLNHCRASSLWLFLPSCHVPHGLMHNFFWLSYTGHQSSQHSMRFQRLVQDLSLSNFTRIGSTNLDVRVAHCRACQSTGRPASCEHFDTLESDYQRMRAASYVKCNSVCLTEPKVTAQVFCCRNGAFGNSFRWEYFIQTARSSA